MEIKHYKDLSTDDKKKYETAKEHLRNLNPSFGFYQRKDGAWTSDVTNVLWGVITPSKRISKAHYQIARFDMRSYTIEKLNKAIEKANAMLYKLPKGYKWTEPIFFEW